MKKLLFLFIPFIIACSSDKHEEEIDLETQAIYDFLMGEGSGTWYQYKPYQDRTRDQLVFSQGSRYWVHKRVWKGGEVIGYEGKYTIEGETISIGRGSGYPFGFSANRDTIYYEHTSRELTKEPSRRFVKYGYLDN